MKPENYELVVALRHELHRHPEVSGEERWTKAHLMAFLRRHTKLEVVDRGLWFYAVYRAPGGGRKIGFRADFDALPIEETIELPWGSEIPGVSHKCGHDGHAASLAGFALEVDQRGCGNTVYFIFQHAEETGDGAKACAVLVEEAGIDEVFGWHNEPGVPLGVVVINTGSFQCASTGMSLFFTGAPAHASDPGVGRNPAAAIARIVTALPSLFRAEENRGLVLATIIHVEIGAPNFGTSAGAGVLRVTLRGQYEEEMNRLAERLDTLAFGLASEYGLDYRAEFCDTFPENCNHAESAEKIRKVSAKLGFETTALPHIKRGSEDFGHFTKATGGAYFNIGAGDVTPHHTVTYDFPDEIIKTGVDMFYGLACGLDA